MTKENELINNEGDPPLDRISAGNSNAHSHVSNVDCEVDPPVAKSNVDQHLVKSNEGEDDDRGKKKKKKPSVESKHKEYNEFKSNEGQDDDQGKKKKKKKLSEGSKHKEYNEFRSNEGEVNDQGKKMKKQKKLIEESKLNKYNEFRSDEGEDGDQGKKMKKKLSNKSRSKENSEFDRNEDDPPLARVKSGDANACSIVTEVNDQGKEMKKEKTPKVSTGGSPNPACDGTSKPKRVTFSDHVEVCCDGLVRGKRYTREEDEKIKAAVSDYIESHGLGDEGLDMVLHCKKHPESRKWTRDELEFVRKVQEQHGSDWKSVAEALDKSRVHIKDAWRRIKSANLNRGRWTQEEIQKLFDLVNLDLRARASEGFRKSKHGMLRDNISWEAIGSKLTTRTSPVCCKKWYEKLASPMVSKGEWSDTDDYRLVNALYALDACCMEEVDWDNLLEHRSGDVCRKRWNQMVQQIGEHGGKPFAEQVEILSKILPPLIGSREDFDNKPVVC
ncbi:SANT/Myb domain [Sesbania bispinosa]|nr:SANT/Myb domain [Sesbania bispinosa]